MKEDVDYELIPSGEDDIWDIRFIEGEFVETVIRFGTIKVAEDKEHINFDFKIVYSPMDWLNTEHYDLQKSVGEVLYSILESAATTANNEVK
jgi:hypothetical protein